MLICMQSDVDQGFCIPIGARRIKRRCVLRNTKTKPQARTVNIRKPKDTKTTRQTPRQQDTTTTRYNDNKTPRHDDIKPLKHEDMKTLLHDMKT